MSYVIFFLVIYSSRDVLLEESFLRKFTIPSISATISILCLYVILYGVDFMILSGRALPFVGQSLHEWCAVCILLFFLSLNYKHPSCSALLAGGILNELTVVANGGFMPVSTEAASAAGLIKFSQGHCAISSPTHFYYLCDIIYFPGLWGILSVGDCLILMGLIIFSIETHIFRKNLRAIK